MLRKKNCGASLTLPSLMSSLVVKHGLRPTLAIGKKFPPGYRVYRKDQADGHGGVLLGISASLNSNQIETETEGKFVAVKVLGSKHAIIFAAAHRPPTCDQTYMDTVNQTLSTLCHKFSNMPI